MVKDQHYCRQRSRQQVHDIPFHEVPTQKVTNLAPTIVVQHRDQSWPPIFISLSNCIGIWNTLPSSKCGVESIYGGSLEQINIGANIQHKVLLTPTILQDASPLLKQKYQLLTMIYDMGVNTLSNPKLHVEFISNNHLGCIMKCCVELGKICQQLNR